MSANYTSTPDHHNGEGGAASPLAAISFFSELPAEELRAIESHANLKSYRKNTVIIEKGDETTSLYVLVSGRVKVYLANEEGRELLLHNLGPGEYFGELALLGGVPRTASVMSIEESKLLVISRQDFMAALNQRPEIAMGVIRFLVKKLQIETDRSAVLALEDVYGRVAATLRKEAREEEGRLITGRLTHQDLAQIVGSSREMVSRIFKDLRQGGYIEVENKRVIIKKNLPAHW